LGLQASAQPPKSQPLRNPQISVYIIDPLTNFSSLLGQEVTQVSIGVGQVILRFHDGLTMNIACPFKLARDRRILFEGDGGNHSTTKDLVCLLSSSIDSVEALGDHELAIHFSGRYCLTLIDDSEYYESFVINGKDFELIC
jgi:Family of unknown function (DUF6188)